MRSNARIGSVLAVVGILALVGLNVRQVARACGACEIYWNDPNPGCTIADSGTRDFAYEVTTQITSASKNAWTLYQAIATGPGSHINGVSANPSTYAVDDTPPGAIEDEVLTACGGHLIEGNSSGFADLSSYDGSGCLDCSGVHRTNVYASGSCP